MTVACLEPTEAVDLVDGRLDEDRARAIDEHVGTCARCRKLVAEVAQSDSRGGGAPGGSAPSSGDHVDRYLLIEPIGRGGMGVVFRARDETLGRDVAIKLVLLDGPEAQSYALREARALARLSHPNVVAIYDAGLHGDATFIAMELIAGVSLQAWLAAAPRTPAQVLAVIADAAAGLAAAHDLGLIHRDVKPGNILVGDDGRSRIADFGLARDATPVARRVSKQLDALQTAQAGTPAYMAPEQVSGRPLDARVDQFALALTAWEGVFGVSPFEELTEWEIAAPPAARRAQVGAQVEAALRRALAVDPGQRFPDLRAFACALAPPPTKRWGARAAVAAAAAAFAGGAIALAIAWPSRSPPADAVHPTDAAPRRETLEITPDHATAADAALAAGKEQFLAGHFEEAAHHFEVALEHFPVAAFAFQIGVSFRDVGRPALARRFFARARDLGDPGQSAAAERELAKLPAP
ncbi:MAG: serine/threonine protein kinase [Myxococcales bacterium]|nr:serine/threonine protein kinase [Myxococcales bacterium]